MQRGWRLGARCSAPSTRERARRLPGRGWWGVRRAFPPWAWRRRGPCLRSCWLRDRADNSRGTPMAAASSLPSLTVAALSPAALLLLSPSSYVRWGVGWCLLGVWAPTVQSVLLASSGVGRSTLPPNFPSPPAPGTCKGRGLAPRCRLTGGRRGNQSPCHPRQCRLVVLPCGHTGDRPSLDVRSRWLACWLAGFRPIHGGLSARLPGLFPPPLPGVMGGGRTQKSLSAPPGSPGPTR